MTRAPARWAITSLLAVMIVGSVLTGSTGAVAAGNGEATDVEPERVFLHVQLHANGSATWTVEYAYRLDTDSKADAFEDLRADVRANRSAYRASFRERIGSSVERAAAETGREMEMGEVTVRTRRQRVGTDTGFVSYRFRWTNFSARNGSELVVGDAIDGFFVDEKTRLEITWPEGYELASVRPAQPDDRSATAAAWDGPTNFAEGEPRLILRNRSVSTAASTATGVPATGTAPPDGRATDTETTPPGGQSADDGAVPHPWLAALAGALVVVVGSLGVASVRGTGQTGANDGPGDGASDAGDRPGDDTGTDGGGDDALDGSIPVELMSSRERVLYALREEGGRMKQQTLRAKLDWPAPKTSKVLGDLKEDGAVEVFRLGRENVVTLPDTGLKEETND